MITGALEIKRAEKIIGSSLETSVNIYASPKIITNLKDIDLAEVAITSEAKLDVKVSKKEGFSIAGIEGVLVEVKKAFGNKCNRCWKVLKEVKKEQNICLRCKDIVNNLHSTSPNI